MAQKNKKQIVNYSLLKLAIVYCSKKIWYYETFINCRKKNWYYTKHKETGIYFYKTYGTIPKNYETLIYYGKTMVLN